MNEEQQLKLQALLDGELPEREAREILAWTQRDTAAAALLAELRNTRQAISKFETHPTIPESREFYWSKIERGIQRLEAVPRRAAKASIFFRLRRLLLPSAVVAVGLVITGLVEYSRIATASAMDDSNAPTVEAMADSDATTYQDKADGTTLVWFSVPEDSQSTPAKAPGVAN